MWSTGSSTLTVLSEDSLVQHDRTTYRPGTTLQPAGPTIMNVSYQPGVSSPWSVAYSEEWAYQGTHKTAAFSPSGQPVFALDFTGIGTGTGTITSTAVLYNSQTWWQVTLQQPVPPANGPGVRCGPAIQVRVGTPDPWQTFIHEQLSCGSFTVTGHQEVDGVDALVLTSTQGGETFWVDPQTYLPVRLVLEGGGPGYMQTDFQWLPPTAANLAQLKLTVPAGFSQVSPPSGQ